MWHCPHCAPLILKVRILIKRGIVPFWTGEYCNKFGVWVLLISPQHQDKMRLIRLTNQQTTTADSCSQIVGLHRAVSQIMAGCAWRVKRRDSWHPSFRGSRPVWNPRRLLKQPETVDQQRCWNLFLWRRGRFLDWWWGISVTLCDFLKRISQTQHVSLSWKQ